MEGGRRYEEYNYNRSVLEEVHGINSEIFGEQTGLRERDFIRQRYIPALDVFLGVHEREPRRGVEVLVSRERETMIVFPPTTGPLTYGGLAEMTVPAVGFIGKRMPDVVVGCDRGGRLYSVAVHGMWVQLRGSTMPFPTLDSKLHFARLSTSLSQQVTQEALGNILERSGMEGSARGKRRNGDKPGIMFIDDLIHSGATRERILFSLGNIVDLDSVDVSFIVMCGSGADASGTGSRVYSSWYDKPENIGVEYNYQGNPSPLRTGAELSVRREIYAAIKEHARNIKKA